MLVQCPKCKTTYKVSDDSVKGPAPSFRCSRCKHTFELEAAPPAAAALAAGRTDEPGEDNELAFTFEPAVLAAPDSSREEPPRQLESAMMSEPATRSKTEWEFKEADTKGKVNTPFIPSGTAAEPKVAPVRQSLQHPPDSGSPAAREINDNVFVIEPHRDQAASVKPFLTLFALLVLLFAFVLAYQNTNPAAAEAWVRSVPFLGHSVARNDNLKSGVLLKSIETRYQNLQGSREVVVLTGVAVNQNPVMIRNVQLAGQLYDHEGREIERQTMWIGNAISSQIVRGMTTQDVSDLQRLKPLKTFEIPSGDSVPFAIVFLRTGKQVKDARCAVLSAEGDA